MFKSGYVKLLCKPSVVFETGCDILVIFVSTYLMSRCFFMIPQTRQFPTMSAMTSMECIVAMAMPDDWSMTECCLCYTVARPSRFNKYMKSKFLSTEPITGKKWQLLNVRYIRCSMNISSLNVSYVHIKGAETSYLQIMFFWFNNFLTT